MLHTRESPGRSEEANVGSGVSGHANGRQLQVPKYPVFFEVQFQVRDLSVCGSGLGPLHIAHQVHQAHKPTVERWASVGPAHRKAGFQGHGRGRARGAWICLTITPPTSPDCNTGIRRLSHRNDQKRNSPSEEPRACLLREGKPSRRTGHGMKQVTSASDVPLSSRAASTLLKQTKPVERRLRPNTQQLAEPSSELHDAISAKAVRSV